LFKYVEHQIWKKHLHPKSLASNMP
jgi:hypothetical protein